MPTLQIEHSLQLYYEDDDFTDPWRTAPVMLLQHGFSRNGRFWYNWVPVLGVEQIVFVGESFGGIIGLQFAHTYPQRTRALVLCNTPCRLPHGELRQRFSAGGDWDAAMARGVAHWSTATIDMRLDTRVAPPGLKEWYIAEMDRTSPAIARKLQAYLDTLDFRDHLKEIT